MSIKEAIAFYKALHDKSYSLLYHYCYQVGKIMITKENLSNITTVKRRKRNMENTN